MKTIKLNLALSILGILTLAMLGVSAVVALRFLPGVGNWLMFAGDSTYIRKLDASFDLMVLIWAAILSLAVGLYLYIDHRSHRKHLALYDPSVPYTLRHHARVVVLPLVNYKKRQISVAIVYPVLAVLVLAFSIGLSPVKRASAATPDSCFGFNSGTGTITDYYYYQNNDPNQLPCTRSVDVPTTIGGVTVVSFDSYSFSNKALKNINIPNTVTGIGDYSLQGNLITSLTIPNSVVSIGSGAFYNSHIQNINFIGAPTGPSNILYGTKLNSITYNNTTYTSTDPIGEDCYVFNAGTNTIQDFHFADLSHINSGGGACINRTLNIPSTIGGVNVINIGGNALYGHNFTSVEIPNTVTSIGYDSFSHNAIHTLSLPSSLVSIGSRAFEANKLTEITVPSSVTTLGDSVFSSNWTLTTATFEGDVSTVGYGQFTYTTVENIQYNGTSYTTSYPATEDCYDFNSGTGTISRFKAADVQNIKTNGNACLSKNLTIPSTIGGTTVTTIGNSAFAYKQIQEITLPNSVSIIQDYAFAYNRISNLVLSNSTTQIGNFAFQTNQIPNVVFPSTVTSIGLQAFGYNNLSNLTLPNSISSLGSYAFTANNLSTVVIPNSIASVGSDVFLINPINTLTYNNTTYTSTDPIGEDCYVFNAGTNTIQDFHFADLSHINSGGGACINRTLNIPSTIGGVNVINIGGNALYGHNFTSVEIPNTVTSIGIGAFSFNDISSLSIPSSVTVIHEFAFMANEISNLTLANSIGRIDRHAFSGNHLTRVNIPISVVRVEPLAFSMQTQIPSPDFTELYKRVVSNPYLSFRQSSFINSYSNEFIATNIFIDATQATNIGVADDFMTEDEATIIDDFDDNRSENIFYNLVNPAHLNITFKTEAGTQLAAPQTITGTGLSSYLLRDNPSGNLGLYYRMGQAITPPAPPSFTGYSLVGTAPSSVSLTGTNGINNLNYVYKVLGSSTPPPSNPPTTPTNPSTPSTPSTPTTPGSSIPAPVPTATNQPTPSSQPEPEANEDTETIVDTPDNIQSGIEPESNPGKRSLPTLAKIAPFFFVSLLWLLAILYALKAWREYRLTQAVFALLKRYQATTSNIKVFLSITAHYLNTPVATMKNALELLQGQATELAVTTKGLSQQLQQLGSYSNQLQQEAQTSLVDSGAAGKVLGSTVGSGTVSQSKLLDFKVIWLPLLGVAVVVVGIDGYFWFNNSYQRSDIQLLNHLLTLGLGIGLLLGVSWLNKRATTYRTSQAHLLVQEQNLHSQRSKLLGEAASNLASHQQLLIQHSTSLSQRADAKPFFGGLAMLGRLVQQLGFTQSLVAIQSVNPAQNLLQATDQVLQTRQTALEAKQIQVSKQLAPDLVIHSQPEQVSYLLSTLVDNAIQFAPSGGQLTITANRVREGIALTVRDNGPGIAADKLTTLFEPFARGTSTETYDHEGLGLSLYNAKLLVEQLGGTIGLANAPSGGLVVEVRI